MCINFVLTFIVLFAGVAAVVAVIGRCIAIGRMAAVEAAAQNFCKGERRFELEPKVWWTQGDRDAPLNLPKRPRKSLNWKICLKIALEAGRKRKIDLGAM